MKTRLSNSLLPNTQASLTICSILLHIPALGLTSVIYIATVTQVSLYYITQAMNLALWRMKPRFWRLLIAASNLCIKAFVQKYLKWCLTNPIISATCRHHSQPTAAAPTLVQWGYISQGSSLLLRISVNEHLCTSPSRVKWQESLHSLFQDFTVNQPTPIVQQHCTLTPKHYIDSSDDIALLPQTSNCFHHMLLITCWQALWQDRRGSPFIRYPAISHNLPSRQSHQQLLIMSTLACFLVSICACTHLFTLAISCIPTCDSYRWSTYTSKKSTSVTFKTQCQSRTNHKQAS